MQTVKTDQRAIIYKLLTRYPQPFTEFRELIQNANDAGARSIRITIGQTQLSIVNDGAPFSADDWGRLVTISKGNPDETKIGYYGVGFYSVFQITETPIVRSGNKECRFGWADTELQYQFVDVPNQSTASTEIICPYRSDPQKADHYRQLWSVDDFRVFLSRMILFTKVLSEISVVAPDGSVQIHIRKHKQPQNDAHVIRHSVAAGGSGELTMSLQPQIRVYRQTIEVTVAQRRCAVPLTIVEGDAQVVACSTQFRERILAITQKRQLVGTATISLAFGATESSPETSGDKLMNTIALRLSPTNARGFASIGFLTQQSTGSGFHVNAPLYCTSDRENLDFENRELGQWNVELLRIAGCIARIYYDSTIESFAQQKGRIAEQELLTLITRFYGGFTFAQSYPKTAINQLIKHGFFNGHTSAIKVPVAAHRLAWSQQTIESTQQQHFIQPISTEIPESLSIQPLSYLPSDLLLECFAALLVVPVSVYKQCRDATPYNFFDTLKTDTLLQAIDFPHLAAPNHIRSLNPSEFVQLIRTVLRHGSTQPEHVRITLYNTIPVPQIGPQQQPMTLSQLRHYHVQDEFSRVPLPHNTISPELKNMFSEAELRELQLTPLTLRVWWDYVKQGIADQQQAHAFWGTYHLSVLVLLSLYQNDIDDAMLAELKSCRCILSRTDQFCRPCDIYFPSDKVLDSLDLVSPQLIAHPMISRALLTRLGVRESLSLPDLFQNLHGDSRVVLMYLFENQNTLTESDINQLRTSLRVPARRRTSLSTSSETVQLPAGEVYVSANDEELEALGLPVLNVDIILNYDMKRFLVSKLGLQEHPSALTLATLSAAEASPTAASGDLPPHRFFAYLCKHLRGVYQPAELQAIAEIAYVPTDAGFCRPADCFAVPNPFAFPTILPQFAGDDICVPLGIRKRPETTQILNRLINACSRFTETAVQDADAVFKQVKTAYEYLAECDITAHHVKQIANHPFVFDPTAKRFVLPAHVFLTAGDYSTALIDQVDYGALANRFLEHCGVKYSPDVSGLAQSLVKNAARFYQHLQTSVHSQHDIFEMYASVLQLICHRWKDINAHIRQTLQQSRIVLAKRSLSATTIETQLMLPNECFINDNKLYELDFRPFCVDSHILHVLGIRYLSKAVSAMPIIDRAQARESQTTRSHLLNVRSRWQLLLMDPSTMQRRENLVPNANDIPANLQILLVDTLQLHLETTHQNVVKPTDAAFLIEHEKICIYVSPTATIHDIGEVLATILFPNSSRFEIATQLSALLAYTDEKLLRLGYPLNLINNSEREHIKAAQLNESYERRKQQEALLASQRLVQAPGTSGASAALSPSGQLLPPRQTHVPSAEASPLTSSRSVIDLNAIVAETMRSISHNNGETHIFSPAVLTQVTHHMHSDSECHEEVNIIRIGAFGSFSVYTPPGAPPAINEPQLQRFVTIISRLCAVTETPENAVSLVILTDDNRLAFNRNRALYFNFDYFCRMDGGGDNTTRSGSGDVEALCFWYVVFCHELAHNVILEHDSRHEFVMQVLISQRLPRLLQSLVQTK